MALPTTDARPLPARGAATRPRSPALRGAAVSLLCLPPALAATFALAGAVGTVAPAVALRGGPALFLAGGVLACAAGGAAWGALLGRTLVPRVPRGRLAAAGALGYALAAPGALAGLAASEGALLERAQEGWTFSMPAAFALLFTAAVVLVVGGATWPLARAAVGPGARALAGRCTLAGALAFLAIDGALHAAGWVVGGPNAEARFTMLVVLAAGMLGATLVAGAVLGRGLARPPHARAGPAA